MLYGGAAAAGAIDLEANAIFTAAVGLSMALIPLRAFVTRRLSVGDEASMGGIEPPASLSGSVLVIGFGRFGRVMSRYLLARSCGICVDDKRAATRIAGLAADAFPPAALLVRSYDREHALELIALGLGYQLRETFESALRFGGETLAALGVEPHEVAAPVADMCRRDAEPSVRRPRR